MNPKLIAFLQTVFYGAAFAVIPMFISALGQGGALAGYLPPLATGAIVWVLNYFENSIQSKTGRALFGTVRA